MAMPSIQEQSLGRRCCNLPAEGATRRPWLTLLMLMFTFATKYVATRNQRHHWAMLLSQGGAKGEGMAGAPPKA